MIVFRKNFSTLMKTPFKAAAKLVNNFTEPKTASTHVHSALTIIFYSINSNPLRSLTASRTAFSPASAISQIIVKKVELGQDPIENAF